MQPSRKVQVGNQSWKSGFFYTWVAAHLWRDFKETSQEQEAADGQAARLCSAPGAPKTPAAHRVPECGPCQPSSASVACTEVLVFHLAPPEKGKLGMTSLPSLK